MTDNEIIKALQCVIGNTISCEECLYKSIALYPECRYRCANDALALINRQKAEIERLKNDIEEANTMERENEIQSIEENKENAKLFLQAIQHAKSEAIQKFVEMLKENMRLEDDCDYDCENCFYDCNKYVLTIDKLAKEMTKEINKEN